MHTPQTEIRLPGIRNPAPIRTSQRMACSEDILHTPSGGFIVRGAVEGDYPPLATVRVAAVTLPVPDIVDAVPDVLVVAGGAVAEFDVEGLGGPVPPWGVVWHSRVADVYPASAEGRAGCFVGGCPGVLVEAAFCGDVGWVVDAVEAVGGVVPGEVCDCPGGEGAAWWGGYRGCGC